MHAVAVHWVTSCNHDADTTNQLCGLGEAAFPLPLMPYSFLHLHIRLSSFPAQLTPHWHASLPARHTDELAFRRRNFTLRRDLSWQREYLDNPNSPLSSSSCCQKDRFFACVLALDEKALIGSSSRARVQKIDSSSASLVLTRARPEVVRRKECRYLESAL